MTLPPVSATAAAGASLTVASLQNTNVSLVLGFLTSAQEGASVSEVSESLGRLEPALDVIGASRAATVTRRLLRSADRTPDEAAWLNAAHDHFGNIINDGIPAREAKGQKAGQSLIELLAENPEALEYLMGDSAKDAALHQDFSSRARQLKRLLASDSPKVTAMDARYKNAILFILEMEPHIPELLALDDTLQFLSAGVWEISSTMYSQMEAAGLVYERLRISLMRLSRAGIENKFEEGVGQAFDLADKLQGIIHEADLTSSISIPPPPPERDPDHVSVAPEEETEEGSQPDNVLPAELTTQEQAGYRFTLGDLLASKPGTPLAKIHQMLKPAAHIQETASEDLLAARIVQNLIDSLDILLDSLRG